MCKGAKFIAYLIEAQPLYFVTPGESTEESVEILGRVPEPGQVFSDNDDQVRAGDPGFPQGHELVDVLLAQFPKARRAWRCGGLLLRERHSCR